MKWTFSRNISCIIWYLSRMSYFSIFIRQQFSWTCVGDCLNSTLIKVILRLMSCQTLVIDLYHRIESIQLVHLVFQEQDPQTIHLINKCLLHKTHLFQLTLRLIFLHFWLINFNYSSLSSSLSWTSQIKFWNFPWRNQRD